jgi:glycosyltransferase involved in cell wall biosynthesis
VRRLRVSRRPKIVHLVVAGAIGGAERVIVSLASRPDKTGAEHCLALMTPNPALRIFFRQAGLKIRDRGPVKENPLAYLWRSFGPMDLAWIERVLEEEGATAIHAHTFGSHVLAARAGLRSGIPVVRTEHGIAHYSDPSCAIYRRWALANTDVVVAVSQYVKNIVERYDPASAKKVRVVPNGIDLDNFRPAISSGNLSFTLAVTSRLAAIKQLHLAIEAVAQVPDVRLDIAGDGDERKRLEALVRKLGVESRVHFLGHLDDPRPLIARCDAVINCTAAEAHPLAIIEAAAMARPTIAFAGGGIPEIVRDQSTGWLTQECSADGFASAIKLACSDRHRAIQYGKSARQFVEGRFGVHEMCAGYAKAYDELAGAGSCVPGSANFS